MRLPPESYRLLYDNDGFGAPFQRDGQQGALQVVADNIRSAGLHSHGNLPRWPTGGIRGGETSNGAGGGGVGGGFGGGAGAGGGGGGGAGAGGGGGGAGGGSAGSAGVGGQNSSPAGNAPVQPPTNGMTVCDLNSSASSSCGGAKPKDDHNGCPSGCCAS